MHGSDQRRVLGCQDIMRDPVMCADGFSYERSAIEDWCACGLGSEPSVLATCGQAVRFVLLSLWLQIPVMGKQR